MTFDRFGGYRGVLAAEMKLQRRFGFFVEKVHVARAVVTDGRHAEPCRREERDGAAPAIADAADAAGRGDRFRRHNHYCYYKL